MTSGTGLRMRSSRDGVCWNNAVQFLSCGGSSYCTALEESGCIDIVSNQLWDSCGYLKDESICRTKTLVSDARTDGKCAVSSFAEPALHNFAILWTIPTDVSLTAARNSLTVACFSENVCKIVAKAADRWTQNQTNGSDFMVPDVGVDSYGIGIQTLVHRYDKCLNNGGDNVEK